MNKLTHLRPADILCRLPLAQLSFYITNGCNLICQYCWPGLTPSAADATQKLLSVDQIKAAVQEALPLGLQEVRLTGGDPFLHPEIDRLLDELGSQGLSVEIETTGRGITPVHVAHLAEMRQCQVVIGLNGPDAASHDAICQDSGSFEAASKAIHLLATAGLAPQVVTSIMRGNVQRLPAIIQVAERLGAASLRLVMANTRLAEINVAGNGSISHKEGHDREGLTVEELIALGRRVERDLSQTTRMQLIFEQPPAFRGLNSASRMTGQSRCSIFNSLSVLPGGEYGLCGITRHIPALTFGKIGEVPLEKIWNDNPTLCAMRQGMPDRLEGVCSHCVMKAICLGNCAVENYLSTGEFWGPYWFCDAAAQRGLFPAGRIIENVW